MNIFSDSLKNRLEKNVIAAVAENSFAFAATEIAKIYSELYESIPDEKRASFGEVYVIKQLAQTISELLQLKSINQFQVGKYLSTHGQDFHVQGTGLFILSIYGLNNFHVILEFFESTAASANWHLREYAQMFFRKLIKEHQEYAHAYLLSKVKSRSPLIRRFVAETLRPVQENRWLFKNIDFSLSILKYLLKEKEPYPRTAVANNISDISKQLPDLILKIVKELAASNNKNSYWIAYRGCRNLVKKYPITVMDILQIDHYKYKTKNYFRHDYQ